MPIPFTKVCSEKSVPTAAAVRRSALAAGADGVVVCVADAPTLARWQRELGAVAEGLQFYSDASANFARLLGVDLDLSAAGACVRRHRPPPPPPP